VHHPPLNRRHRPITAFLGALLGVLALASPARANCADPIADRKLVQPALERHWRQLKEQQTYPWGAVRPFSSLSGDRITLSADFDRLDGAAKRQVIETLRLGTNPDWLSLLSPAEQKAALADPGLGSIAPHTVVAHDGRLISYAYDGCTRPLLLTEFARYQQGWLGRTLPPRIMRFPIDPATDQAVRRSFWQAVAPHRADVRWIAWVPEQGFFEITVAARPGAERSLDAFWKVAPRRLPYRVLEEGGSLVKAVDPKMY
jgi:hypothetical protein